MGERRSIYRRWGASLVGFCLIMSHVLLPAPAAQAADESWTTYGRYGVIAASELGGFNEPTNMAVGRDGHMYIADAGNNRIQKLDMAAGTWSEWRDAGSLGAFQPADVTADVYGNVYVADLMNHRVLKRSASDGEWSAWGKTGGGSGIGPGEFNRPTGLDVDAAGNVYVTDRENHRLQKWDASAETWSVWGGTARGSGPGQFNYLDDVAVDADGNVYVADTNNHRIQKLDAQSNTWSEWGRGGGASGDGPGEFYLPASVAVDSSGNVYVADAENHRIQKRDASSGEWIVWGRSGGGAGDGPGEFKKPGGISVDASGNVYVADTENDRVQKLAADTKVWTEWAAYGNSSGAALGQFNRPGGVATDGEGNVYVVEFTNQRVQKLTVDGMTWSSWGKSGGGAGNGAGEFSRPTGIAADDSGNLYVADTFNNRIQMMNAADAAWSQLGGGSGSGVGQFNRPSGAAIDGNGRLYIADTNNHRIQMRDAEGNWSLVGGGQGSALGQFSQPTGVAVDAWGNLYVADTGNHRVQRWSVSDDEWTAWGSGGVSGSGLGEFNSPTGVAVDRSGNVYAVDQANHRVQKWTKESGVWSQWGGGIPGSDPGQFNSPHSVAVDGLGNLYITDQGNHRLQKLSFGPKAPTLDAPTLDAPIPGDGQVALSWSKVEGATGYTLFLSDSADALGTEVATVTETVYTVTGLTNGTTYSFVVRGINGGAVGAASAPVSATPFTVPGAPRNVTATAGDGQATIHFDAPSTDGGREIVEYEVSSAPGGHTGTGAASPIGESYHRNRTDERDELHVHGRGEERRGPRAVLLRLERGRSAIDERIGRRYRRIRRRYRRIGRDPLDVDGPAAERSGRRRDRLGERQSRVDRAGDLVGARRPDGRHGGDRSRSAGAAAGVGGAGSDRIDPGRFGIECRRRTAERTHGGANGKRPSDIADPYGRGDVYAARAADRHRERRPTIRRGGAAAGDHGANRDRGADGGAGRGAGEGGGRPPVHVRRAAGRVYGSGGI